MGLGAWGAGPEARRAGAQGVTREALTLRSACNAPTWPSAPLPLCTTSGGALRLMFCTPEKVASSKRFLSKLEKLHAAGQLARVAVDEAHCVSQVPAARVCAPFVFACARRRDVGWTLVIAFWDAQSFKRPAVVPKRAYPPRAGPPRACPAVGQRLPAGLQAPLPPEAAVPQRAAPRPHRDRHGPGARARRRRAAGGCRPLVAPVRPRTRPDSSRASCSQRVESSRGLQ